MPILAERGYLIPATNSLDVDYVSCAVQLARSLREWHPTVNISLLTNDKCNDPVFDHVIPLPHTDLGGYANDWQCFDASPYRQTIKLEADMVIASPIDHWWTLLELRDVVVSQGCRNIYDQPAQSRYYRELFDRNGLPDVYNAITYWRLSKTAYDFFTVIKDIFVNWELYKKCLIMPEKTPSTDVVYAMAAIIMGPERVTLPPGLAPTIVHMKQHMIQSATNNWTQEWTWEATDPGVRINTIAQWGAVHYHQKQWRLYE